MQGSQRTGEIGVAGPSSLVHPLIPDKGPKICMCAAGGVGVGGGRAGVTGKGSKGKGREERALKP